uniref:Uncharacterized protein n=1 Tax=Macaca fascicularis TaxID=9541 RepID=A0A7N9ICN3_MACFA
VEFVLLHSSWATEQDSVSKTKKTKNWLGDASRQDPPPWSWSANTDGPTSHLPKPRSHLTSCVFLSAFKKEYLLRKINNGPGTVAHGCNFSTLGNQCRRIASGHEFKTSLGNIAGSTLSLQKRKNYLGMHHHTWLIFVFLVETGFHHVGQASLELPTLGDPPALASQSARITGVSHCAQLTLKIIIRTFPHQLHPWFLPLSPPVVSGPFYEWRR